MKTQQRFLLGSATSAYQHEGGLYNTDWRKWELQDKPFDPITNQSVDFWNRWQSDFDLAILDGHNYHRFGVEWSRVFPKKNEVDTKAVERYVEMAKYLKSHNMAVAVNLFHFSLPDWLENGWVNPEAITEWEKYVCVVIKAMGSYVDYWSSMIDSQLYIYSGYVLGKTPPKRVLDKQGAQTVIEALFDAHATVYHVAKAVNANYQVGMIYFFQLFKPKHFISRFVTSFLDKRFNWMFLDILTKTDEWVYISPFWNIAFSKEQLARWSGTIDWIGLNYFSKTDIGLFDKKKFKGADPESEMGWDIYPKGLATMFKKISKRYGKNIPILITENGVSDHGTEVKAKYIKDHYEVVKKLRKEYPEQLLGYTAWSLTDGLEWADGYKYKFGLYRVDQSDVTLTRHPTEASSVFSKICKGEGT